MKIKKHRGKYYIGTIIKGVKCTVVLPGYISVDDMVSVLKSLKEVE